MRIRIAYATTKDVGFDVELEIGEFIVSIERVLDGEFVVSIERVLDGGYNTDWYRVYIGNMSGPPS